MTSKVYEGGATWGRTAYLKLVDDKIVFDCSDGEYGPIEFDIKLLTDVLSKHHYAIPQDEYNRRRDKMAEQYKQIEQAINQWDNANKITLGIAWKITENRSVGELTTQIMEILNTK